MNKDKIEYDFDPDAFLKVNKGLLNRFGPEVAVFISNLIDKHKYFNENFPENDGWFFLIHKQQMEQTGLTVWKLYKCKRIAILNKWIETKLIGSPAKEWYKINLEQLNYQSAMEKPNGSIICESVRIGKTSQLVIRKPDGLPLENLMAYKENKEGEHKKEIEKEKIGRNFSLSTLGEESVTNEVNEKELWKDMDSCLSYYDLIIKLFLNIYPVYKVTDQTKEELAAQKLGDLWRKLYPEMFDRELLESLKDYFERCKTIKDLWLRERMSLNLMVTKFNEIQTQLSKHDPSNFDSIKMDYHDKE